MPAIQKVTHLSVVHRLTVKGTDIAPVEAPADLPEDASPKAVIAAYHDLVDRLTEAGILIPNTEEADAK